MKRHSAFTFNLLLCAMFCCAATILHAQGKTKLAEGEYTTKTGKTKANDESLDRWTLWKLKDGTLQAEIRVELEGGQMVQKFLFTPEFKRAGYGMAAEKEGKEGGKLSVDCELLSQVIKCLEEFNGKNSSADFAVSSSDYAFGCRGFYGPDFIWFFVLLIQNKREDAEAPIYILENNSGVAVIEPDKKPEKIHFMGTDTVVIMGKSVQALKYTLGQSETSWVVWTAPSNGMVLVVADASQGPSGMRWKLTNFKSYRPDFMPELR